MPRNLPLLLIRVLAGIVFLTEGILKFLYPGELGSGRFAHVGLPMPNVLAPAVGAVEIAAGGALILNAYVGPAAILLLCVITTAIVTTKVPILLGHNLGPFPVPKNTAHTGVLGFLHESRTDLAMLFSLAAILVDLRGAGSRPRR
ncbi:DoxX family protein [Acidobacteria bacterium AB60]|nr:DoxX family protein [Acidobacteria bacterium AB60]